MAVPTPGQSGSLPQFHRELLRHGKYGRSAEINLPCACAARVFWPQAAGEAVLSGGWRQLGGTLPNSADWVGIENRIDTDDRHRFHDRLRDDHAVEWVPVMVRQGDQFGRVPRLNRQDGESVVGNRVLKEIRKWLRELQLTRADLDRDLPVTGGTHEDPIVRISHQGPCRRT